MSDRETNRQILQYLQNLHSLIDVLSWIASRFDKAVDRLEGQAAIDDVLRELSEYLTNNIDRIDRLLLVILEKMPEGKPSPRITEETAELKRETIDNRIKSLRTQQKQHRENLNYCQEQAALYGANVTVEIENQIKWTIAKIKEIEAEINYLQQDQ